MSDLNFRKCPIPISEYPIILTAHGGGGRLMNQLIERLFLAVFSNEQLSRRHDSAVLPVTGGKIAFTTDSYVITPLFFPGGDIGSLSIYGTINDLAASGAKPAFVSAAFILEEGFPMETLWRVALSMAEAVKAAGVEIVTGDTKVVERGKCDGLYINTSGIGVIDHSLDIRPQSIRPGDAVIVNGDTGRHGAAVLAARGDLSLDADIRSDAAPLHDIVQDMIAAGIELRCLRDLTRGGLASALNEIAAAAGLSVEIEEDKIPIDAAVNSLCEVIGIDPLHVANEGRMVYFVPERDAGRAVATIKKHRAGKDAVIIGRVTEKTAARVTLITTLGVRRILPMFSGEQLPRIC